MFNAFRASGRRIAQSGRKFFANAPVMLAGVAGAGAAASSVAYADTIIEIMNGQDTVKITLTNPPVDMNYPPHGISDTLKDFPDWIKVGWEHNFHDLRNSDKFNEISLNKFQEVSQSFTKFRKV